MLWRKQHAARIAEQRKQLALTAIAFPALLLCLSTVVYLFLTADPLSVQFNLYASPDERITLYVESYQHGFFRAVRYTELRISGEDYGGVVLAKWEHARVRLKWLDDNRLQTSFCTTDEEHQKVRPFATVYQPSQRMEAKWNGHDWPRVPVGERHAPIQIEYQFTCAFSVERARERGVD